MTTTTAGASTTADARLPTLDQSQAYTRSTTPTPKVPTVSHTDSLLILDPTDEGDPIARRSAERPAHLAGTVGIVDISKPRGDIFCDELADLFRQRFPDLDVVRLRKPTFTKPAPSDLRAEIIRRCSGVIQALAD